MAKLWGMACDNSYNCKENVMDAAQDSFISSTFWTERIGPTAALKTLEEMERIKSWELINTGKVIRKHWLEIAKEIT